MKFLPLFIVCFVNKSTMKKKLIDVRFDFDGFIKYLKKTKNKKQKKKEHNTPPFHYVVKHVHSNVSPVYAYHQERSVPILVVLVTQHLILMVSFFEILVPPLLSHPHSIYHNVSQ